MRTLTPPLRAAAASALRAQPKIKAAHYYTPEHRAWARDVVARAGRACQTCGRTSVRLFADHIIELQDGGPALDLDNGQALCGACHTRKTSRARARRQTGGGG